MMKNRISHEPQSTLDDKQPLVKVRTVSDLLMALKRLGRSWVHRINISPKDFIKGGNWRDDTKWNVLDILNSLCLDPDTGLTQSGKMTASSIRRMVGRVSRELDLPPHRVYAMTLIVFATKVQKLYSAKSTRDGQSTTQPATTPSPLSSSPSVAAVASQLETKPKSNRRVEQKRGVSLLVTALLVSEDDEDAAKATKKQWHKDTNLPRPIGHDPDHKQRQLYDPSQMAEYLFRIGLTGKYAKLTSLKQKLRSIARDVPS